MWIHLDLNYMTAVIFYTVLLFYFLNFCEDRKKFSLVVDNL